MSVGRIKFGIMKTACACVTYKSTRSFVATACKLKEREKEQWTTVKEKWLLPKEEWKSFFHYFSPEKGITIDMIHILQKKIDFSPKAIKAWYQGFKNTRSILDQSFIPERVNVLGCELAAAHFIVYRGGKVRAKGSEEWTVLDENDDYNLPRHYKPGYFVEAIDASGTSLLYEGFECLGNLDYLEWLNLADCTHTDDWCLDRICGQYSSTLQYLNITNCTKVSAKGIAACGRLRELKTLDLTGLHSIQDIEIVCLLLEDVNPRLEIIGINYMDSPKLQGNLD